MRIHSDTQSVFIGNLVNSFSKHFVTTVFVTDLCIDIENTIKTCHVSGLRNIEMDDIAFSFKEVLTNQGDGNILSHDENK